MSGISRPQLPQDPFQRPATVSYTGTPAGYNPAPLNQTAQWQQQQQHHQPPPQQQGQAWPSQGPQAPATQQQPSAYNPAAYPPMPSSSGQPGQPSQLYGAQPVSQQQYPPSAPSIQQQYQSPAPGTQQPPQVPPHPPGYQPETQQNNRWSISFPTQAPNQGQFGNIAPQYTPPIPPGATSSPPAATGFGPQINTNTSVYSQPPHGQSNTQYANTQQTPTQANPGHQFPVTGQNAQHQQYYVAQQQGHAQTHQPPQGYQYSGQQHPAPPLSQSPQQTFGPNQTPQGYPPQNQSQAPPVNPTQQQWQNPQQTSSPPPTAWPQQFQQYPHQQPPAPALHGQSQAPVQYKPSLSQEEPVSPIVTGRQNTIDHKNSVPSIHSASSRPDSNHGPSRTPSNVSQKHTHTPSTVSSPPRNENSPSQVQQKPPRRYVDPNGVGATGASALGFGGPSDWETLGNPDFEVDDLELYATRRDPEPKKKHESKGSDSAPVELPAGSPVATQNNAPWKESGMVVEADAGTGAMQPTRVELENGAARPPHQSMGTSNDSSMIISSEPVGEPMFSPPTSTQGHQSWAAGAQGAAVQQPAVTSIQNFASQPTQNQGTVVSTAESNSFVITDNSGWAAPQTNQPKQFHQVPAPAPPVQHPHGAVTVQNESMIVEGGWNPAQQPSTGVVAHASTPSTHGGMVQPPTHTYIHTASGQQQGQPLHQRIPSVPPNQIAQAFPTSPSQEEFRKIQTRLGQAESELVQFKEKAVQQRLMGEQNTEEVATLKDKIARLHTECQSAQTEVVALERSLERAENSSATAANEKAALEKEKAIIQAKVTELESSVSATRAEIESNKAEMTTKLIAADAALVTVKAEADTTKATHESKIKDLETSLSEAKLEITNLKKQLEDEKAKAVDIAPGLNSWFKDSLERYRDSLFKEATAIAIQDKIQIFQDIVNAEAGQRGITIPFDAPRRPSAQQAAPPTTITSELPIPPQSEKLKSTRPNVGTQQGNRPMDDAEYSPGGRPILNRAAPTRATSDILPLQAHSVQQGPIIPPIDSIAPPHGPTAPQTSSAGSSAQGSPAIKPFKAYRNHSVPDGSDHSHSKSAPRPSLPSVNMKAYTGFKYQPSSTTTSEPNTMPVTPAENKSVVHPTLGRSAFSTPQIPTQHTQNKRISIVKPVEDFLPEDPKSDRKRDRASSIPVVPENLPVLLKPKTPAPPTIPEKAESTTPHPKQSLPLKRINTALPPLESLLDLLPELRMPVPASTHPQLAPLRAELTRFSPPDFAFIVSMTSAWELQAVATRRRLESERAKRQAELEEDPSRLFQEGEIDYGDIAALEDEMKRRETKAQEKESADEWASYLAEVFDPIYSRLQGEIAELLRVKGNAERIVHAAVSGTRRLDIEAHPDNGASVALVDALDLLVSVHAAMEERRREAGKAVAERDKKYKKNVTGNLWRKKQVAEMKRIEAAMDKSERKADIGRRTEKWEGLKALYKIVKVSIKRGVDDNERSVDEILKAVIRLGNDPSAAGGDDTFVRAALRRTKDVMKDLGDSSLRLMRLYGKVDHDLNEAEFEAMLANERANDALPDVFDDLNAQKKDQDTLLQEEAAKRESGIDQAMMRWQRELDGVLDKFGGSADSGPPAGGKETEGDEVKRRLRTALEVAKRRNGEA